MIESTDGNTRESNARRTRNRKPKQQMWARNKAKACREKGEEYMGFRRVGKTMIQDTMRSARKMKSACSSKECKRVKARHCSDITEDQRREIFKHFWQNTTWEQRRSFITTHVKKSATSRIYTTNENSRRKNSLQYFLTVKDPTGGERTVQVCKRTFLNTLGIGDNLVRQWMKDSENGMAISNECIVKRRSPPSNKAKKEERKKILIDFLENLPKLPSHYARKNTEKLYIEPFVTTLMELYKIYIGECELINEVPLSRFTFSETFQDMKLSLLQLKKDKCDVCVSHEVKLVSDEEWQKHWAQKERARQEKEKDTENAKKNIGSVFTMDVESVKVAPFVNASAMYFKTKLCCHNFTVYENATHRATCFWFDETATDMTASTFTSCIIEFLKSECQDIRQGPIIFWSDGCTYQNRNAILSNALLEYAIQNDIEIIQKYLVVGHTQMECDSVHARIESYLKGRPIYLPHDYVRFTSEARHTPFPYISREMTFADFKDYSQPFAHRYNSIRPGANRKNEPVVTDLRALRYTPDGKIISFKLDFDDDWKDLPQRAKQIQHPIQYAPLYTQPRKIPSTKWDHLQSLKMAIPAVYHNFYDNLKC